MVATSTTNDASGLARFLPDAISVRIREVGSSEGSASTVNVHSQTVIATMQYHASSYQFRGWGVLLGLVFHLAMFAWAFTSENTLAGGYRFLFTWYMPSLVLGLPWSIPALFADAFVPGLGLLGLAAAVCFNGYLAGWVLDAIVNGGRQARRRQVGATLRTKALTMDRLLASEAARADDLI